MTSGHSMNEATNYVAHYEQLRNDALSMAHGGAPAPGLALFLRKGMTAWMQAWSPGPQNAAATSAPPSGATQSCPPDIRTQIAAVLAGIILNQQLEVNR